MSGVSPRQQVALNLMDTCFFGSLNDSYGTSCEKATDSKGKAHWSVLFCKARVLDGVIRVYSEGYILITWQGMGERNGKYVARSEHDAKTFLISRFIRPLV